MSELKACQHEWEFGPMGNSVSCNQRGCVAFLDEGQILDILNTRHAEQGWREYPKEKPPKLELDVFPRRVWVTYRNGVVAKIIWYDGKDDEWIGVIAWMPWMPERYPTPYKPEGEKV